MPQDLSLTAVKPIPCDFNIDLAVEKPHKPRLLLLICPCKNLWHSRKIGAGSINATAEQLNNLTHDAEKELIRHIAGLTDEVINAAKQLDPQKLPAMSMTRQYPISLQRLPPRLR